MVRVFPILFIISAAALAQYSGGNGTVEDPFQIAAAKDLVFLGENVNHYENHFVMIADIDLAGYTFERAIVAPDVNDNRVSFGYFYGYSDSDFQGVSFAGTFDGRGHTIRNVSFQIDEGDYIGLFGELEHGGIVRNLILDNIQINSNGRVVLVGGLVAFNWGTIHNCIVRSKMALTEGRIVGGLVGQNVGCIHQSQAESNITSDGGYYIGGLVGQNSPGRLFNCYVGGTVCGYQAIGGLIGANIDGIVVRCTSTVNVIGIDGVGGLIGGCSDSCLIQCLGLGSIESDSKNRDLFSESWGGNVLSGCFYHSETSEETDFTGLEGLTLGELSNQNIFLSAGWDFCGERKNGTADLWCMSDDMGHPILASSKMDYQQPSLKGQGTPGDPFQISSAEDLGAISHYSPFANHKLMNDINLSGITWGTAVISCFDGQFDGGGYLIRSMTQSSAGFMGLFGHLGEKAYIHNLGVEGAYLLCMDRAHESGMFAAFSEGAIEACFTKGSVISREGGWRIGGFVGINEGTINDCYSQGIVVAGYENMSRYVGGFVGYEDSDSITHCYTATQVRAESRFHTVGWFSGGRHGRVSANNTGCYFLFLGPLDGVYGKALPLSEQQMKQQASFPEWDFIGETENGTEDIWGIANGNDYPRLWWELGDD